MEAKPKAQKPEGQEEGQEEGTGRLRGYGLSTVAESVNHSFSQGSGIVAGGRGLG